MVDVPMEVVGVDDRTVHMESPAGHWCSVVMQDWKRPPAVKERVTVALDADDYPLEVRRGDEVIWP